MATVSGSSQDRPTGSFHTGRKSVSAEAFRLLDWTKLDAPPSAVDVKRLMSLGSVSGSARLAVLVDTPRMLRAAAMFAEQASTQGAAVRVFTNGEEAIRWLYKDAEELLQQV